MLSMINSRTLARSPSVIARRERMNSAYLTCIMGNSDMSISHRVGLITVLILLAAMFLFILD